MKKHFLTLILFTLILLSAVFTAQANEADSVYAAAVQMTADNVLSSGNCTAYCPACGKTAQWEPLTSITTVPHIKTDKHYYLSADVSNTTYYSFESKVCLHLNGHNLLSSARAIYVETGATLNIMGDGTVTGKGLAHSACDRGGAVDNAGTLNLFGGTYRHTGAYPVIAGRGSKGGINIYDGTRITGTSGVSGSNVRVYVSYLNVYGGVIENGIAEQGGNILGTKNAKVTIAGGTVTGGTVYMAEDSASLTLTGSPKVDVINLFDGPKASIGGLTEGADIQIVGQGAITETRDDIETYAKFFRSPNELVKLSVKDGALYGTVDTTGDSQAPLCDGKTLKILCLTSSFGLNTTELLYDIAVAEGFQEVIVARLYASGCSLQKHVDSYNNNVEVYQYTKFTASGKTTDSAAHLLDGLLDEDWDIIFIQQGAERTGQLNTYVDYLDQLMDIVNNHKTNPNARFIWNMTWAFQSDNTRKVFTDTFQNSQLFMHEKIIDAMQEKILTRSDFCAMIPTGAAVQNARSSYFGDRLTKDTLHLNNLGRVIAGYTLYATLTDRDLTEVNVGVVKSYDLTTPIRLSETDRQVVIESVNAARTDPFAVKQSRYTPEYLNGIGQKAASLSFTAGETTALCPYCEKDAVWKPLTNSSATALTVTEGNWGHYYLAEDLTVSTTYFHIPTEESHAGYCLHLNGHSIQNTGKRALWVGAGNTLNIMGTGTVCGVGEGSSDSEYRATALDVNGHVNLFGGTYTQGAARPAVLLRTSATRVNLYDGASIAGNQSYSASLVHLRIGGAEFNMFGGTVEGGTAVNGGNIRLSAKAVFNLFGGTVKNGYATRIGGNVYAANGTVNMYGGTVLGGKTENSSASYGRGGNVAICGTSGSTTPAFYMYGGVIGSETVTGEAAGYASAGGANLYVANGTADILGESAVISGGYGKLYGGNIMVSSNAYITLTKGTVKNGSSNLGGNVYLAGTTSNFNQNGGTVADGTAVKSGGNYYVNNGNFTMAGGTSRGGTAPLGSNLHLKTGKTLASNLAAVHHDPAVSATVPVISGGTVRCEYNVTFGSFSAQSSFTFADTSVLTAAEGLLLENAQFDSALVDLAGNDASLSGTGSLACYDSANEDLKTFGTLTLSGVALENPGRETFNGKDYYTLSQGSTHSFHILSMDITGVALRPSAGGMYFTAVWSCDDTLAASIDGYGVAVSTHNMPGDNFATDPEEDNLWTAFNGLESGKEKTGVLITGILKEDRASGLNDACSRMPVCAVAYITLGGNTYTSTGVSMSLQQLLGHLQTGGHDLEDFLTYWRQYGLSM